MVFLHTFDIYALHHPRTETYPTPSPGRKLTLTDITPSPRTETYTTPSPRTETYPTPSPRTETSHL